MTADPQENFNIASLPEYKEVFESNDDGVDEEDGPKMGTFGQKWPKKMALQVAKSKF